MTNPNPVAPKTDTPATQEIRTTLCPKCDFPYFPLSDGPMEYVCAYCSMLENCAVLESTLAAERASRVQADTEQFNAGWNAAIEAADYVAGEEYWVNSDLRNSIRALAKPSVSPEREKP